MRKLITIMALLMSVNASGQEKLETLGVAANGGLFFNHKSAGVQGGMSFFASKKKHHAELVLKTFEGLILKRLPLENYQLLGALYGRTIKNSNDKFVAFGGLGIINGITRGDLWFDKYYRGGFIGGPYTIKHYYKQEVWMPTLMLKLEGRFPLAQIIDFRTSVYANLTYKVPSFGFQVGFGFGKVREKKR